MPIEIRQDEEATLEVGRASTPRRRPNGKAPQDYNPPPWVVSEMKRIDPALGIEWDPYGIWWPTHKQKEPPQGFGYGAWRITVRGKSGAKRGLRMWPPTCCDGRLIDHLRETWGRRAYLYRNAMAAQSQDDYDRYMAQMEQQERQPFEDWWESIDHSEAYRAAKAANEAPKWRMNWQVHANTPTPTPAPTDTSKST